MTEVFQAGGALAVDPITKILTHSTANTNSNGLMAGTTGRPCLSFRRCKTMWANGESIRIYDADTDGDPALLRDVHVEPGNAFRNEIDHFLQCIESGAEPITSGRDQLASLAAVSAAYRSMETGRRVALRE